MGTGTHDQIAGFLLGQAGDFRQLVRRQFGQIVTRMHLTLGQLGSQLGRHAFEFQQVLRGLKTLFLGDRLGQQRIAGAGTQLIDGVFVERLDFQQFLHGA